VLAAGNMLTEALAACSNARREKGIFMAATS
jgi:hypothetical protein